MKNTLEPAADDISKNLLYFPRATTAIHIALRAYSTFGKIIIPSTICLDPIVASYYANYEPIFVGVKGFQIDLKKTIEALNSDPKINAVLLPFLYGYPIEGLIEFWSEIKTREILVIEDLAQTLGPSHFSTFEGKPKVVTVYSCGQTKIINHQQLGVVHSPDIEIYSAMKSIRPKELLISEQAYELLKQQYRESYEFFLDSKTYENNWESFYKATWKSDPRLFMPLLENPINKSLSLQVLRLQSPGLSLRKKRHLELIELFRDFQGAVLPDTNNLPRPIWRTTIQLPNNERDQLFKFMKSKRLFASKWYKAMHRYVPDSLIQRSLDLRTAELFEEQVINFRIDSGLTDRNFENYKISIKNWIFSR